MHSRCFRQPKNNFNEIDISQDLDWEPPALSLHFLLAINDHRSLKGAVLAAENNFLEHNGVSHSKLQFVNGTCDVREKGENVLWV